MPPIIPEYKTASLPRTGYGGPPSQAPQSGPTPGSIILHHHDSFQSSSNSGLRDLNEAITKNRALHQMRFPGVDMLFGQQLTVAPSKGGGLPRIGRGLLKIGGGLLATQADSPLPGPADAIGAGMVSSGARDIGLGFLDLVLPASSFQMPKNWPKPGENEDCDKCHKLHRAVPRAEKESIEALSRFSSPPGQANGKYFSPTRVQAIRFANSPFNRKHPVMWRATGVLPPGVPHKHLNLTPSEGPAVFVEESYLKDIKHVRVRERVK